MNEIAQQAAVQGFKENSPDVSVREPVGKTAGVGLAMFGIFVATAKLYEEGSKMDAKDVSGGMLNKLAVHATNKVAEGVNHVASFVNNAAEMCNNTFGSSLGQAFETSTDVKDTLIKGAFIGLAIGLGSIGINALLHKSNKPNQPSAKVGNNSALKR